MIAFLKERTTFRINLKMEVVNIMFVISVKRFSQQDGHYVDPCLTTANHNICEKKYLSKEALNNHKI